MRRLVTELAQELDKVTASVFQAMMSLPCEPFVMCEKEVVSDTGGMSARVEFLGALEGCCVVMLRPGGAVALVRAMLDLDATAGDEISVDAVGELCNMIAGGWKSGLEPDACAAAMTPPQNGPAPCDVAPATVSRRYMFAGNVLDVELRLPGFAA